MKSLKNNHKHLFIILFFTALIPSTIMAQTSTGIGFKGGLNYNANGDYF